MTDLSVIKSVSYYGANNSHVVVSICSLRMYFYIITNLRSKRTLMVKAVKKKKRE